MNKSKAGVAISIVSLLALVTVAGAQSVKTSPDMTFFITSAGLGKGADLGGLAGADRHCEQLAVSDKDPTCGNWTRSGEGSAMLGHHDRLGVRDDLPSRSWNASHLSRDCSQDGLRSTGGAGMFYCFAVNTR